MLRSAPSAATARQERIETFGVEPVPAELRTQGAFDLFRILFMVNVNPMTMILGALAVSVGGLPFWWAIAATALGHGLAVGCLAVAALVGVDHGLPGQVSLRAVFGLTGARLLTSPFRVVVSTYWFAAQTVAVSVALHAIVRDLTGHAVSAVPIAVALGGAEVVLAVIGFHALRHLARVMLPMAIAFIGVIVVIYATAGDPAFSFSNATGSAGLSFSWAGFATFVTVQWVAAASYVTNVADVCRYTRSRSAMYAGLSLGSMSGVLAAASLGAYAAAAAGTGDPFEAVTQVAAGPALLLVLGAAALTQSMAINVLNLYSAGLSLTNSLPRVGRVRATVAIGAFAAALCAVPSVVTEANRWVVQLGVVSTPVAGVILADQLVRRRRPLDVRALFDARGAYRYFHGINVGALAALALAAVAYSRVPEPWVKAAWGTAAAAAGYLAADVLARARAAHGPLEMS